MLNELYDLSKKEECICCKQTRPQSEGYYLFDPKVCKGVSPQEYGFDRSKELSFLCEYCVRDFKNVDDEELFPSKDKKL